LSIIEKKERREGLGGNIKLFLARGKIRFGDVFVLKTHIRGCPSKVN
jgi:hypothetical protein